MHPDVEPRARRVHSAEIKSKVLAECSQPGASVSAVALAHGLNTNLVRKWLRGRGLQRAGLMVAREQAARAAPAMRLIAHDSASELQFVPVQVSTPGAAAMDAAGVPVRSDAQAAAVVGATIAVELRRGDSQLAVRWPAAQAADCAAWLRELAAAVLHGRRRP